MKSAVRYAREDLRGDVTAGATVAIMLVLFVARAGWPQRLGAAMDYPSLWTAVREIRRTTSEPANQDASKNQVP